MESKKNSLTPRRREMKSSSGEKGQEDSKKLIKGHKLSLIKQVKPEDITW